MAIKICHVCGIGKTGKRNLHVHHIDKNKQNNAHSNLITLCALCHRRVHSLKIDPNAWTN
jgi:predicted HNH restriction endonuclease